MAITLSQTFANALMQHSGTGVLDQILGGSIVVYSCATPPDGANESASQHATATVLATFTLDNTFSDYGSPSAGVLPLKFTGNVVNLTVTAVATGTASFFRILNSSSASLVQGTVGISGADFNLSSVSIASGDNVSITGTPSLTMPVT